MQYHFQISKSESVFLGSIYSSSACFPKASRWQVFPDGPSDIIMWLCPAQVGRASWEQETKLLVACRAIAVQSEWMKNRRHQIYLASPCWETSEEYWKLSVSETSASLSTPAVSQTLDGCFKFLDRFCGRFSVLTQGSSIKTTNTGEKPVFG